MRAKMQTGLRMQYGYSTQYNEENEKLTSAWDIMQTRVSIEAPCFQLNSFKVKSCHILRVVLCIFSI